MVIETLLLCAVSELLDFWDIYSDLACSEIVDVGHDKMDQRWLFERKVRDRNCD
jgi:hypothetical protein